MRSLFNIKNILIFTFSSLIAYSSSAAEQYYRWYDENGVVHYGAAPPQGVDAEKVKIYTGKGTPAKYPSKKPSSEDSGASPDNSTAQTPETKERQQQQIEDCKRERKRLKALEANTPIRMKQTDGTLKYLTKEEIAQEVQRSREYIKDVCP